MSTVHWLAEPEDHDYGAARDYLELIASPDVVVPTVTALRKASMISRKAKDLLRASGLETLGEDNPHVAKDLKKVRAGTQLSPVLLVRGDATRGRPLIIADGYHRICAVHFADEDANVPCHLADLTT